MIGNLKNVIDKGIDTLNLYRHWHTRRLVYTKHMIYLALCGSEMDETGQIIDSIPLAEVTLIRL